MGSVFSATSKIHPRKKRKTGGDYELNQSSRVYPDLSGMTSYEINFYQEVQRLQHRSGADLLFERRQREKKELFRRIAEENVKEQVRSQMELLKRNEEKDYVTQNLEILPVKKKPKVEDDYFPANVKKISLKSCIGKGAWGSLYIAEVILKVRGHKSDNLYAVKAYGNQKLEREPVSGYLETSILKKMKHPNIVEYISHGYFEESSIWNSTYLVLQYLPGGSLKDTLLLQSKPDPFELKTLLQLTIDISGALAYMHEFHNLVHRDVKPANILLSRQISKCAKVDQTAECFQIDDKLVFKLCDFGSARKFDDQNDGVFTKTYAAPELITRKAHVAGACDIYSLGLVLLQCVTRIKPDESSTSGAFTGKEKQLNKLISSVDANMRGLIKPCLQTNPELRVSGNELGSQATKLFEAETTNEDQSCNELTKVET